MASERQSHRDADVLVVGAGAAGLAAAHRVSQFGLNVVVLEARERIGGRILTVHDSSVPAPLDLGAEFIHGTPGTLFPLIRETGLGVHEIPDKSWVCSSSGLRKSNAMIKAWGKASHRMEDAASEQTFRSFLSKSALPTDVKKFATRYIEGFHAADPNRISVQSLTIENEASNRVHGKRLFALDKGYIALMQRYVQARNVAVQLNRCVRTIRWTGGRVDVEFTSGGSSHTQILSAKAAVITVPLPLLQATNSERSIRFEPGLPSVRNAARRLAMGHVVKLILNFAEPVWKQQANAGFLFCPDAAFPTWWICGSCDTHVITAWAGGPPAERLLGHEPEELLSTAIQSLSGILKVSETYLQKKLRSCFFHDWSRDPFSLGAYSYTPKGCFDARAALASPIENTLFFAGEAADTTGAHGTVHGAVGSGLFAARGLAEVFGISEKQWRKAG